MQNYGAISLNTAYYKNLTLKKEMCYVKQKPQVLNETKWFYTLCMSGKIHPVPYRICMNYLEKIYGMKNNKKKRRHIQTVWSVYKNHLWGNQTAVSKGRWSFSYVNLFFISVSGTYKVLSLFTGGLNCKHKKLPVGSGKEWGITVQPMNERIDYSEKFKKIGPGGFVWPQPKGGGVTV